jgi:hypothetical protein
MSIGRTSPVGCQSLDRRGVTKRSATRVSTPVDGPACPLQDLRTESPKGDRIMAQGLGVFLLTLGIGVFVLRPLVRAGRAFIRRRQIRAEIRQLAKAPVMPFRAADVGTPMFLVDELQIDRSLEE